MDALACLSFHSFNPRHRLRALLSWISSRKCRRYYISTGKMYQGLTQRHMKPRQRNIFYFNKCSNQAWDAPTLRWQGSLLSSSLDEEEKTDIAGGHASAGKHFIAIFKEMQRHKLRFELPWPRSLYLIVYTFLHICQQCIIFIVYWKCGQCWNKMNSSGLLVRWFLFRSFCTRIAAKG